jgi:hypothetical protein
MSSNDTEWSWDIITTANTSADYVTTATRARRGFAYARTGEEEDVGEEKEEEDVGEEKDVPPPPRSKRPRFSDVGIAAIILCSVLVIVAIVVGSFAAAGAFNAPTPTSAPAPPPAPTVPTTVMSTVPMATAGALDESSGTPDVVVTSLCNHVLEGADEGFCVAVFSWDNSAGAPVAVPIGADNYMVPGPLADDHPTIFAPSLWYGAVSSRWRCGDGGSASLTWVLRTDAGVSVATTSAAHRECPDLPV